MKTLTQIMIKNTALERSMAMAKDNEPRIKYLNERLTLLHRIEAIQYDLTHSDEKQSIFLRYKLELLQQELVRLDESMRKNTCNWIW